MTYSIVRPTAFFKSVSGQYESILQGNSYVLFGDGAATQCNPIAEEDLAKFMCDSALEEYKEQRWGKILNVGGPDAPRTAEEGAACALWLATREFNAGDTTGVLWEDNQIVEW